MRASRNLRPSLFSLGVLILIGAGLVVTIGNAQAAYTTPSSPPPHAAFGAAAIPRTRTGVPAFTSDDVRQYLSTHTVPGWAGPKSSHSRILEIVFITKEQASAIMKGEDIPMLPAHALVCYVQLQGPFTDQGGFLPPAAQPTTFQIGEMAFDAQTGNLLGWGMR